MEPAIHLAPGASENGLALMLSGLVQQNLIDHPAKKQTFLKMAGRIVIQALDIGVSLTLVFARGRLTVYDGVVGVPDVVVRAPSEEITYLSLVELEPRFGLPDPRGENTRHVMQASRDGRIEVRGLLPNLLTMLRLTKVMSVN